MVDSIILDLVFHRKSEINDQQFLSL